MKIRDARPIRQDRSERGFSTIARFNFEPFDGLVIYDCTLVRAPDGRVLIYGPPSKSSSQIISMAPAVRRELIKMTLDAVGIDSEYSSAA